MQVRGFGQSDVGRVRDKNEDAYHVDDDLGLYIVSDGMGGHAAGEIASAEAIRSTARVISEGIADGSSKDDCVALLERAIQTACRDVYELARSDPNKAGMGCTLTAALIRKGHAVIGHVGDSRCYLHRDGEVSLVTTDHTVASELARAGLLSEDQSEVSPFASTLSRAIGTHEAVQVDAFAIPLLGGDELLLCSDGLSEYIDSPDWLARQMHGTAHDACIEELIAHANDGGGRDNVTAVLVAVETSDEDPERASRREARIGGRLEALSRVFLFEQLSVGVLSRLLSHCEVRRLADGEPVFEEGESCRQLVVVTEGRFELYRGARRIGTLGPGEHTAVTTLLRPRPARARMVAAGPSALLMLERSNFWKLVKQRPWAGLNLLERLLGALSRDLDASIDRRDDGDAETTPLESYQLL